jgi:hypothetical protein
MTNPYMMQTDAETLARALCETRADRRAMMRNMTPRGRRAEKRLIRAFSQINQKELT